ncbi:hypothetical protein FSP39_004930 [Pinctada imbricata]|uniref:Tripartite motif-containing protein 2 n=1 Tax=Pinctada imbricata TaxID=66713 RepID=A0AA88XVH1_PINIB|nr:hypothetical protein FSP39_004930 [Pinctada imbricata]
MITSEPVVSQEIDDHSKTNNTGIVPTNAPTFSKDMISVKKNVSFNCVSFGLAIITVGYDKAWIMDHKSDTMYFYNSRGKQIKSKTIQRDCNINYMVLTRFGDMVVSTDDSNIRLLSYNGLVSSQIDTKPLKPEGLCLTDTEEIAVCLRDLRDRKDGANVTVFSRDGKQKIRQMRGRSSGGNFYITDPFRVVNVRDVFVVVNCMEDAVCVDNDDFTIWQYKGQCANLLKAFQPLDVDKDNYSNLLITDGKNHCVHYIDINGELLRLILTNEEIGMYYHWGISVNKKTGDVWLGNSIGTSDIVVASYLSGCTK